MTLTLESAIAAFGAAAKAKLSNPSATGQPEEQLRGPFENLLGDLAELAGLKRNSVTAVGETALADIKTRPDYSVTVGGALAGFIEIKAPGKGADPRKFKDAHDKDQWERLRSLPNLIYTDGNAFSLWQNGELAESIVELDGDIETSGKKLKAPHDLVAIFQFFLLWKPIPPRSAKELAHVSARLSRLLRAEVEEQMALGSHALTELAKDWRKLLFPDASDERFADGYAQAVTFGLLMARAKDIPLSSSLQQVATELKKTNSLIGTALWLLTDNAENQATLKTSLGTLTRVLDVVSWKKISKGQPDAWLYFYEEFLEIYDNDLRKKTGSYYTPPEVVSAMVRLVDDVLRSNRFGQHAGLASAAVTLSDPATGTGTFILGVLRRIAETVTNDEGAGSVGGAIEEAIKRLIAFEMQLGPFAVAQLRILAEVVSLTGEVPKKPLRMFVTNTLGNPLQEEEWFGFAYEPIGESRREANRIKREEPITVVIGNPPYKEKAKGRGGWVEGENDKAEKDAPLADWMPPRDWGVGAHSKHLRNLYIYFWRWATWKAYDHGPGDKTGIVCFITVAGFLGGPGFQKMRDYLRRTCNDIWVIDCSPERHQPEVATRIFQDVQQPVCIVLTSRSAKNDPAVPAKVRFHSLPPGNRETKFEALGKLGISGSKWVDCPTGWREPFLPASTGAWATFPKLEQLFVYNGSGVMPGRTWIIAPDVQSLEQRWSKLVGATPDLKETLFHPHLVKKKAKDGDPAAKRGEEELELGDRHSKRVLSSALPGFKGELKSVAAEDGDCITPVRYGVRSFDRQWIIPDNRVINRPNPDLWAARSDRQVFLAALSRTSPTNGPAFTITGIIPDLDHYNGRGGRIFPLWHDSDATSANLPPKLLPYLSERYGHAVNAEDFIAYIAGILAHPAFTIRFQEDLSTPGLRVPITADRTTFAEVADVGRTIIWLHTFGERMIDPEQGRPALPPRLPKNKRPNIPAAGAIPLDEESMPDTIGYDPGKSRLLVGNGFVENVPVAVWNYEVSGKQVLVQWFSSRKKDRERPMIGDRRPPSPLGKIQPKHWIAEYTTELLNLVNVLGWLVDLEPKQAELLEKVCSNQIITTDDLNAAGALEVPAEETESVDDPQQAKLF